MFDLGPDPLAAQLEKPGDAPWIVAPLVVTGETDEHLIGYLAADNVPENSRFDLEPERNWLQCGMSVIAVAAATALMQFPSWNPGSPDAKYSTAAV